MAMSEIADAKPADDRRSKWIGVWIGVLATLLAFCTLGGNNATKDAMRANVDAVNMWGFFQAKNLRRTAYTLAADELELTLGANPAMPLEAKAAIEAKIKTHRTAIERLKSDKETNEGLDELWARGKAIEADREIAFRKDPYFDLAQALLQIAIVLSSVALITSSNTLVTVSGLLGIGGTLLMLNGFTLAVKLPFLG